MTTAVEIKDWADKNTTFIYAADMTPLGYINCECATEWAAYRADGSFVDWFGSKRAAKAALQ